MTPFSSPISFVGTKTLSVQSVLKPLRRRELDCVTGGKGEFFPCLWITSFSSGPCHGRERPETGEENPFPFRQRFRECVERGLDELFRFGFR